MLCSGTGVVQKTPVGLVPGTYACGPNGLVSARLSSQMKANDPLKSDASRLLAKMSEFMYREPYFEGTKRGHWAYWIPYVYDLTDREKSDHNYRLIGQATFWTVLPYETTGDNRWIERMKKMMKMALWDESGVWGSYGYLDHPGFQTIGYYLNRLYFPERYR